MAIKEIRVPDMGGAANVDVIEISVKPGDLVAVEQSIVTLESDKATMEIPSTDAGVVQSVVVKVGDKVSEGSVLVLLEQADEKATAVEPVAVAEATAPKVETPVLQDVHVPDIGGAATVDVIEVSVKPGDVIAVDQSIITLESDKATMEIPSPAAGVVKSVAVKVGDKVSEGSIILALETIGGSAKQAASSKKEVSLPRQSVQAVPVAASFVSSHDAHAGPAVRRLAYELGVDLTKVTGTGRKGRVLLEDIHAFVKRLIQQSNGGGLSVPAAPVIDFSKFGSVDIQPLTKINKLTGVNLHRNWVTIPHVTQFEDADITEMEEFRQANKASFEAQGAKLTPIIFVMKAVVAALKKYPKFNSSLGSEGETLVLKKYFHIGVAVDTPNGLVVPVIRDVDQKGMTELAIELAKISVKAREGKLLPGEMQGGCFTISSLGGIGGTYFTPIVNAPEVAILGVSRSELKPRFIDKEFKPRLMLPLSLSYDHRVIDGADGARFVTYLANCLTDLRQLLLS